MITIHTMAYNEEVRLQFMIDHYKTCFPSSKIIIYDNESTDSTAVIAKNNGCEVITINSNGEINENLLLNLKNNCWKNSATDWVLVCDPDEIIHITEQDLKNEESVNSTIIKICGYHMINMDDCINWQDISYGFRFENFDKSCIFNKKYITDINYNHGCHKSNPVGTVKYSINEYKLYHYHCIGTEFVLNRYKISAERLSKVNKENGWGKYVLETEEETIKRLDEYRKIAIRVK